MHEAHEQRKQNRQGYAFEEAFFQILPKESYISEVFKKMFLTIYNWLFMFEICKTFNIKRNIPLSLPYRENTA